MAVELQTVLSRNDDKFIFNELGTEIVIMNIESGDYLGLNEVSSQVWKLMEKPIETADIIKRLMQDFDVNEKDCEEQTLIVLNKMKDQGMLILK
jgi:hypothetical protein